MIGFYVKSRSYCNFSYFKFVGNSLGVNKNKMLNVLFIDIFLVNVVIIDSIIKDWFLFVLDKNIYIF